MDSEAGGGPRAAIGKVGARKGGRYVREMMCYDGVALKHDHQESKH